MKKHLPAAPDSGVWIVTGSLIGLMFLILALAGGISSLTTPWLIGLYSAAGALGLILLIGWLAKPALYEVRDDSLTIVRSWPFRRIFIPKSEIKDIRHVRIERVVPCGPSFPWVFGYSGRFRSDDLSSFILLATNPHEAVMIDAGKPYIVSPANAKRFAHDLSGKK